MRDDVSEQLRVTAEELSNNYFVRLWESRRAECEVWSARRIDRGRRRVVESIALIGFDTADAREWPGYFEAVRERKWFSREWVPIQTAQAAMAGIEQRLRRWIGEDA